MEVTWTDKAIESYVKVIDYSKDNFGTFATIDLTHKVEETMEKMRKYPSASPLVPFLHVNGRVLRYVSLKGPLQLIYEEEEEVCTILTVWNTHMSPTKFKKIISK